MGSVFNGFLGVNRKRNIRHSCVASTTVLLSDRMCCVPPRIKYQHDLCPQSIPRTAGPVPLKRARSHRSHSFLLPSSTCSVVLSTGRCSSSNSSLLVYSLDRSISTFVRSWFYLYPDLRVRWWRLLFSDVRPWSRRRMRRGHLRLQRRNRAPVGGNTCSINRTYFHFFCGWLRPEAAAISH